MIKNGLFLASIGMLILMFSVNRQTLHYDLLSLTTAAFLIVIGVLMAYRGSKKEKTEDTAKGEVKK
ncbi:MAG: DUF3188 domain-containing protein [Carnobacterium sp.]|uniref:DUF3188 domain-containing protein n=1 Tax=unclassified Carnobacterium TaxID=257487 RepID=UPI001911977B|nr:DUF3188 domain-containing protein [Carnobacterium sp. CS13]QQP69608.1 DUF3188 domain-containing protein [Carnobacterium sp. CS13]